MNLYDTGDICMRKMTHTKSGDINEVCVMIGYKGNYDTIISSINKIDFSVNKDYYIKTVISSLTVIIQHIIYIEATDNDKLEAITEEYVNKCLNVKENTCLNDIDIVTTQYCSLMNKLGNIENYKKYFIVSKMQNQELSNYNFLSLHTVLDIINTQYNNLKELSKTNVLSLNLETDIKIGRFYLIRKKVKFDIVLCLGVTTDNLYVFVTVIKDVDYSRFKEIYASLSSRMQTSSFLELLLNERRGKTRFISLDKTKLYDLDLQITEKQILYNTYNWKFKFVDTIITY